MMRTGPPAARPNGSSSRFRVTRLIQMTAGVSVVLSLVLILTWPWCQVAIIRFSLHGYAAEVRRANRSLEEKERLLDRIEALDDRLRDGATIGTPRWIEAVGAIRKMLSNGIDPDEVRLIERELQRLERELK